MLDHICISVSDIARSRAFYEAVLQPLNYGVVMEYEHGGASGVGFGRDGKPSFWIGTAPPGPYWKENHQVNRSPIHVAFQAATRDAVDDFHKAALEAGGEDYGAPGVREVYHPNYYGAFVLDPDGNNVEAVCHTG